MKLGHISDLHLGKRLGEYSLIEDQRFILEQILNILRADAVEAILIAGDVYDKSVPSTEAVLLFDDFLCSLSDMGCKTFVISGNHDSSERLSFGARLMSGGGIYFAGVYNGEVRPVALDDEYGRLNIYMLPFVKPAAVRRFFPDERIDSYTDALRVAVENMNIDPSERNILVAHQFVTGAVRSESEELSVGGLDNVDVNVFENFDYTALGHLHSPQRCSRDNIRYSGTPLKYSFSEADDEKSLTLVELSEKGDVRISLRTLMPLREMHNIRGKYEDLMSRAFYEGTTYRDDYVRIILTDEDDIPEALTRLRSVYHNLTSLDYDNTRTKNRGDYVDSAELRRKSPSELFSEFYEMRNGKPMSEEQTEIVERLIEDIWGDVI